MGTVYLIHFEHPIGDLGNPRGVGWTLARTWKGGRDLERRLKNQHNSPRLCPICKGEQ